MTCLSTLLRVKWQDKVPDTEVPQHAESESINAFINYCALRFNNKANDTTLRSLALSSEEEIDNDTPKATLKLCNFRTPMKRSAGWTDLDRIQVACYDDNRMRKRNRIVREWKKAQVLPPIWPSVRNLPTLHPDSFE